METLLKIVQTVNMYLSDYVLVILLIGAGLYFTIRTKFVQVRCFGEGWRRFFGEFSLNGEKHKAGMSSFQALATAVAAQVGTGNIVGACGAILIGGPGAIFWMWFIAFFGMATIYAEAVLAQETRVVEPDGTILGGPVYYIKHAFPNGFGKFLAGFFAVAIILALGFKKQPARDREAEPSAHAKAASCQTDAKPESVASLMKREVYTLDENDTALDALKLFVEMGTSGAPVVNGMGELTGFVSDGDVLGSLAKQDTSYSSFYAFTIDDGSSFNQKAAELRNISVGEIATQDVITVNVHDDMRDVCNTLAKHHLKKAPVMNGKRMVGIINRSNITRFAVGLFANS